MESLSRFFGVFDGELAPDVCEDIIRRFEADERHVVGMVGDSKDGGGAVDPRVKSTTEILLWTHHQGWEDVNTLITESLKRRLREYLSPYGEAFPIGIFPEEPRITRYRVGEGFNAWHSDNIGRSPTRVITAIWYLNTVERGGETWYKWQDVAVRPVVGRLLLCPVGWPFIHRGNPPESGPKYILITQLHQAAPKAVPGSHKATGPARPERPEAASRTGLGPGKPSGDV
jgi:hypothetical protein